VNIISLSWAAIISLAIAVSVLGSIFYTRTQKPTEVSYQTQTSQTALQDSPQAITFTETQVPLEASYASISASEVEDSVVVSTRDKTAKSEAPQANLAAANISKSEEEVIQKPPVPSLVISGNSQPAATLALSGAGGVPFTYFTLSAGDTDVNINSITIQRTGLGMDNAFDGVTLSNEDEDIGDGSFNSNHQLIIKEQFVIPAHTSVNYTISGDMVEDLADFAGQAPTLSVVAIDASVPVTGLPITGTAQIINSTIEIGGATAMLGEYDPGTDINRYIGNTNVRFSGIRITANSREDLSLDSITWRQNGTASAHDIGNVFAVINGSTYQTENDGREYTATFSPAIIIKKGQSIEVYLQGDLLASGAQRTVKFDINESGAISLTGNTYGYGVGIAAEGNTATTGNSVFITSDGSTEGDEGTPFYSAPQVTINGGSAVTIQNATN
jgi:hypothetical protein